MVASLLLLMAVAIISGFVNTAGEREAEAKATASGAMVNQPVASIWMVRLNFWKADVRTLANVVRYVLEAEPQLQVPTNLPTVTASFEVAMPTNTAMVNPKA